MTYAAINGVAGRDEMSGLLLLMFKLTRWLLPHS